MSTCIITEIRETMIPSIPGALRDIDAQILVMLIKFHVRGMEELLILLTGLKTFVKELHLECSNQ